MNQYKVDRAMLETFSTEEIQRILDEEVDDYTPEAIAVFRDILQTRGIAAGNDITESLGFASAQSRNYSSIMIKSPRDALFFLNDTLQGVLEGRISPAKGQAAATIVEAMLKAVEQDYMQGAEE
jgi:hypothetical protein